MQRTAPFPAAFALQVFPCSVARCSRRFEFVQHILEFLWIKRHALKCSKGIHSVKGDQVKSPSFKSPAPFSSCPPRSFAHRNPYGISLRPLEHARIPPSPSQCQDCAIIVLAMPASLGQPPFSGLRLRTANAAAKVSSSGGLASLPVAIFMSSGTSARKALK